MRLEKPNNSHKEIYESVLIEWKKLEDVTEMSPEAFFDGNSFDEFLNIVNKRSQGIGYKVPDQLFFSILNGKIVGAIDIRFHIDDPVVSLRTGHIGYGTAPEYRKKGHATKMLSLALIECKKIGLNKVLITCDTDNIASSKVIEKNGGILENILDIDNKQISRYWINL